VVFSSLAEKAGVDFDQEILNLQMPTKRLPKQLMFIPAMLLLSLIWFLQRGRSKKLQEAAQLLEMRA
jgi:predicted nucleic-acid-binding protein